jgi:hypothetical protein
MWKIFLILLIFLYGHTLTSQVISRMQYVDYDGKTVVSRYKSESLILKSPLITRDTIFLNVVSDSIDDKTITFKIYVLYPPNLNPKGNDIVITYKDGTIDVFKQIRLDNSNYAEYLASFGINSIAYKPVKKILLRGIDSYDDIDKDYFKEFFYYIEYGE